MEIKFILYRMNFYLYLTKIKSGEFNYLYGVEKSQWDMMEQMIRSSNKKSKI